MCTYGSPCFQVTRSRELLLLRQEIATAKFSKDCRSSLYYGDGLWAYWSEVLLFIIDSRFCVIYITISQQANMIISCWLQLDCTVWLLSFLSCRWLWIEQIIASSSVVLKFTDCTTLYKELTLVLSWWILRLKLHDMFDTILVAGKNLKQIGRRTLIT